MSGTHALTRITHALASMSPPPRFLILNAQEPGKTGHSTWNREDRLPDAGAASLISLVTTWTQALWGTTPPPPHHPAPWAGSITPPVCITLFPAGRLPTAHDDVEVLHVASWPLHLLAMLPALLVSTQLQGHGFISLNSCS